MKEWQRKYWYFNQKWIRLKWKIHNFFLSKKKVDSVTLIVVGRNDNYGGDFSDRLRTILDWNLPQLPNPELVYVEWNQVEDRESDAEWIASRYKNAKCYVVPKSVHDKITSNPKMPVMEYFGKNIGIRKATSDWVLILNADILLGLDVFEAIKKANKKYVYGTHYNNINWDQKPITDHHVTNKSILLQSFAANKKLNAVVGNCIFTHKDNWLKAQGYDESLADVRAGVDTDGLNQILSFGVKTGVLGNHYHLDHNESIIHGANATHGNTERFKNRRYPYHNPDNWGFVDLKEVKIKEHIWRLEEI